MTAELQQLELRGIVEGLRSENAALRAAGDERLQSLQSQARLVARWLVPRVVANACDWCRQWRLAG